ncbi:MAG: DUF3107 family protein [Acidimicrobiia bacterium]|nr:DUF3107 family protein [Acidimicrobiia bacterium]
MSDTTSTRVKFGLSHVPRELDLEVEDGDALVEEFASALDEGTKLLWVTDKAGRRHGLVVDKIVYVDVEPEKTKPGIGFSV